MLPQAGWLDPWNWLAGAGCLDLAAWSWLSLPCSLTPQQLQLTTLELELPAQELLLHFAHTVDALRCR